MLENCIYLFMPSWKEDNRSEEIVTMARQIFRVELLWCRVSDIVVDKNVRSCPIDRRKLYVEQSAMSLGAFYV